MIQIIRFLAKYIVFILLTLSVMQAYAICRVGIPMTLCFDNVNTSHGSFKFNLSGGVTQEDTTLTNSYQKFQLCVTDMKKPIVISVSSPDGHTITESVGQRLTPTLVVSVWLDQPTFKRSVVRLNYKWAGENSCPS